MPLGQGAEILLNATSQISPTPVNAKVRDIAISIIIVFEETFHYTLRLKIVFTFASDQQFYIHEFPVFPCASFFIPYQKMGGSLGEANQERWENSKEGRWVAGLL